MPSKGAIFAMCLSGLVISASHGFPADQLESLASTKQSLTTHLNDLFRSSSTVQTRQGPIAAAAGAAAAAVAPNILQTIFQQVATNAANRFFDELAKLTAPAFFQVVSGAFTGFTQMQRNLTEGMFSFNQEMALADITEEMLTRNGDGAAGDDVDDGEKIIGPEIGSKIVHSGGDPFKQAVYKALDAAVQDMLKKTKNPQHVSDPEGPADSAEVYFKGH